MPTVLTNNSHRTGLALFALGVIVFLGQHYVLSFFTIVFTRFVPFNFNAILQAYVWTYAIALILIISGVVLFYRARKESNQASSIAESG